MSVGPGTSVVVVKVLPPTVTVVTVVEPGTVVVLVEVAAASVTVTTVVVVLPGSVW